MEIARRLGERLSANPTSRALADFLARRKAIDPLKFTELSLSVVKLIGAGRYKIEAAGLEQQGHFGLAIEDYTYSTAPNRRDADLVTQRLLKAVVNNDPPPYTKEILEEIAQRCNERESAAKKVERFMRKAATAALLGGHIGQMFEGIVTGVKSTGTFVRLITPPAEGRLIRGEEGLDVGDRVPVRLVSVDEKQGHIDFERIK
ncbi:MAG: RNB domain-containing ribonuclease [Pyrinomonadaceae bacterium]